VFGSAFSVPGVLVGRRCPFPVQRSGAKMAEPSTEHDLVARQIVDAAFAVHSALGPGLLEPVYGQCLACKVEARDFPSSGKSRCRFDIGTDRSMRGTRMDLVVGGLVVVAIKATEKTLPVHMAQLVTYLKLSGYQLGLLINFNVALIKLWHQAAREQPIN
jgi:GxxExxY protein